MAACPRDARTFVLKTFFLSFHTSETSLAGYLPVLFSTVAIASWVLLAASLNTGQFGDNIEQYVWAHGVQWGYWKHPPLPTFLIAAVIRVAGPSVYWAYMLAALCFIGAVFFTWKIAARLLGTKSGAIVAVLLALHFGFSWRAQVYNHNSVLLFLVAATVWAAIRAADTKNMSRWIGAGCLAGLALLTKYQAAVPLIGVLSALWLSGSLGEQRNRFGADIALVCACLVFLPHVLWLFAHDFMPFRYAEHAMRNLSFGARLETLAGFLAVQLRFYFAMLICVAAVVLFSRYRKPADGMQSPAIDPTEVRAWMWGLIGVPGLFLSAIVLLAGVRLESHWGLQTFQFLPLWIAWRFRSSLLRPSLQQWMIAAFAVHAIGMAFYWHSTRTGGEQAMVKNADRAFLAQALAARVLTDWRASTGCPLKYIVGPAFEAGSIALYSGHDPVVLEDGDHAKSPWVDLDDLAAAGAVQVRQRLDQLPAGVTAIGSMKVPGRGDRRGSAVDLYWGIVLPRYPCNH